LTLNQQNNSQFHSFTREKAKTCGFMEVSRDTRVLRLLCVSDTHLNWKHIDQAALLAPAHDVVLCSGDLGVYNHETKVVSDLVAQADMDEVLRRLEHGHDRPVFYVPGNHDAPSSFDPLLKMGARAVNVHASRLSGKQKKKRRLISIAVFGFVPVSSFWALVEQFLLIRTVTFAGLDSRSRSMSWEKN
jgi:Icc-related predicted phosphoesterase